MTGERRVELQWLRAVAAIEVIICHSDLLTKHFSPYRVSDVGWYYPLAATGVELFFLLSGYVICVRASQVPSSGVFFLSRVYRLYPMYWIFTSLVGAAHLINPAWPEGFSFDPVSVVASYLILPQPGFPLLSVGWTLQHEMLFYAVVALMMYAIGRGRGLMLAVAPLLGLMGCIGCVFGSNIVPSLWAYYICSPFMFAFGLGWLIRSCEEAGWRAVMLPALLFGCFGLLAAVFGGALPGRILYRIMFAALIFVVVISFRQFAKTENALGRLMYNVGDASFSVYLCHWFVLSAIGKMLGTIHLPAAADLPVRLLFIPVSVAVGYGFYVSLEKPISRWLRRPSAAPSEKRSFIAMMLQKRARRPAFAANRGLETSGRDGRQMNKNTSIFLDAVRFLAALAVFLGHIELIWAPGLVPFAAGIGTPAVGIFFVLSGFVIAFAVDRKETDTYNYFVNRAARVYSVVVPVLALTMALDVAGSWMARDIYVALGLGTWKEAIKDVLSLTFVNQIWFLNIVPGSNGPFWSLAFEVPYYLIFGLWHFGQTGRWRLLAVLALVAVGPEIALLFVLWLAGVATYKICIMIVLTHGVARVLLGISLLLWALLSRWSLHYYAQFFAAGIPFALAIIGFSQSGLSLERWERPIRWLAGATFTLYLVHYPIGVLLQTQIPPSWPIGVRWLLFIVVILTAAFLLAQVTERRKDVWRRLLTHLSSKKAFLAFFAPTIPAQRA